MTPTPACFACCSSCYAGSLRQGLGDEPHHPQKKFQNHDPRDDLRPLEKGEVQLEKFSLLIAMMSPAMAKSTDDTPLYLFANIVLNSPITCDWLQYHPSLGTNIVVNFQTKFQHSRSLSPGQLNAYSGND
ncbi:hypothetical protein BDZ45DRAFT_735646 [Acephala macrosclerotiorum]|nr:hypothetical protein BDZ45DRAFT_735646 [Acephala macrosclerotiorum]